MDLKKLWQVILNWSAFNVILFFSLEILRRPLSDNNEVIELEEVCVWSENTQQMQNRKEKAKRKRKQKSKHASVNLWFYLFFFYVWVEGGI